MFILEPLFSLFLPAIFMRTVLVNSFKYDQGSNSGGMGFVSKTENQAETDGLVKRLRGTSKVALNQSDLKLFKSSWSGLQQFRLSYCMSICV